MNTNVSTRRKRTLSGLLGGLVVATVLAVPAPAHATVAPPAGYPAGIDVSSHDWDSATPLNWAAEAANGITFAFIKATEGLSYVNPHYSSDDTAAKSLGIVAGAYAFGRPDLGNPVGQADHLVDTMHWTNDGMTLPPFLDLEWPYGGIAPSPCYGLSTTQMVSWISSFLSRVQSRLGRAPMIYTAAGWWSPCTGNSSAFSAYGLDIVSCNTPRPTMPGWGTTWTFWQYEIPDCGRGAPHDYDVFNGTLEQLAQLAGGGSAAQSSGSVVFNGNLYEFAHGADGTIRYWFGNGGPWSGVNSIGSGIVGDPVATVFGGNLYVFGTAADGTIRYWYGNGGPWSGVNTLGSGVSGGLTSTVFGGNLYVFGRAADGTIRYWYGNGGPWSGVNTVGTGVNGALSSMVFGGNLYLFGTAADGTVRYWYGNGGPWSGVNTVGSGVAGGLSSAVFGGNLYLIGRGTDGTLRYWYGNGGPWSGVNTLGSGISGAVSSAVFGGNLYVFGRGTDGTAKYWYGNGGPWSGMNSLGDGLA